MRIAYSALLLLPVLVVFASLIAVFIGRGVRPTQSDFDELRRHSAGYVLHQAKASIAVRGNVERQAMRIAATASAGEALRLSRDRASKTAMLLVFLSAGATWLLATTHLNSLARRFRDSLPGLITLIARSPTAGR